MWIPRLRGDLVDDCSLRPAPDVLNIRSAPICHDRAEDNCRGGTRVLRFQPSSTPRWMALKKRNERLPDYHPFLETSFSFYFHPLFPTPGKLLPPRSLACASFSLSLFLRFVLACPRENTNTTLCKRCEKFAPLSSSVRFTNARKNRIEREGSIRCAFLSCFCNFLT